MRGNEAATGEGSMAALKAGKRDEAPGFDWTLPESEREIWSDWLLPESEVLSSTFHAAPPLHASSLAKNLNLANAATSSALLYLPRHLRLGVRCDWLMPDSEMSTAHDNGAVRLGPAGRHEHRSASRARACRTQTTLELLAHFLPAHPKSELAQNLKPLRIGAHEMFRPVHSPTLLGGHSTGGRPAEHADLSVISRVNTP